VKFSAEDWVHSGFFPDFLICQMACDCSNNTLALWKAARSGICFPFATQPAGIETCSLVWRPITSYGSTKPGAEEGVDCGFSSRVDRSPNSASSIERNHKWESKPPCKARNLV